MNQNLYFQIINNETSVFDFHVKISIIIYLVRKLIFRILNSLQTGGVIDLHEKQEFYIELSVLSIKSQRVTFESTQATYAGSNNTLLMHALTWF